LPKCRFNKINKVCELLNGEVVEEGHRCITESGNIYGTYRDYCQLLIVNESNFENKKRNEFTTFTNSTSTAPTNSTSIVPSGTTDNTSIVPSGTTGDTSIVPSGTTGDTSIVPSGTTGDTSIVPSGTTGDTSTVPTDTTDTSTVNQGYYLKNDNGELVSASNTSGTLYYCSDKFNTETCTVALNSAIKTGYYYNADTSLEIPLPYIKCQKGSNNCKSISAVITNTNDCSIAGEGGIIGVKEGENPIIYKLCLNSLQIGKAVSLSTAGKYFVSVNKGNVFGESPGHFAMVEIDSNGNIFKNGNYFIDYLFIIKLFLHYYFNIKI